MRYVSYKDYYIVASGSSNEITGNYYPIASVSREEKYRSGHVHIIKNPGDQRKTQEEACDLAVELAKAWIDRQVNPT
jgi:hypothetical protein